MKNYNYSKFANKEYDLIHSLGIKIGEFIQDFTFLSLDGETKRLSDFLDKPIILETGSFTCGMFAGQNKAMNQLAIENKDFHFLLLYVREAHPGKLVNAHKNIEEKCKLAIRLNSEDNIENRTVIIDDISGKIHTILGALPNMVFIIDKKRQIIFKDEWNNAKFLKDAILDFRKNKKPIKQKWSMLPLPNIPLEYKTFKRAGWNASIDFVKALPKLIISHLYGGLRGKFTKI